MLTNLFSCALSPPKWKKTVVSPEPKLNIYDDLSDSDGEKDFMNQKQNVNNDNNDDNKDLFFDVELDEVKCQEIERSVERKRLKKMKILEKEIQEKIIKKAVQIMERSSISAKEKSNSRWSFNSYGSPRKSVGVESNVNNDNNNNITNKATEDDSVMNSSAANVSTTVAATIANQQDGPSSSSPSQSSNPTRSSFFSQRKRVAIVPLESAIFICKRHYQVELQEGYLKIEEEMKRECASLKIVALEEIKKSGGGLHMVRKLRRRSSDNDSDNDDDGNFVIKPGEKERKLSIATAETAITITDKLLEEVRLPSIQRSDHDGSDSNSISKDYDNNGVDAEELRKVTIEIQSKLELEVDKIQETHVDVRAKSNSKRKVSFSDEVEQGVSKREEIAALVQINAFNAELSSDDEDNDDNNDDENGKENTITEQDIPVKKDDNNEDNNDDENGKKNTTTEQDIPVQKDEYNNDNNDNENGEKNTTTEQDIPVQKDDNNNDNNDDENGEKNTTTEQDIPVQKDEYNNDKIVEEMITNLDSIDVEKDDDIRMPSS